MSDSKRRVFRCISCRVQIEGLWPTLFTRPLESRRLRRPEDPIRWPGDARNAASLRAIICAGMAISIAVLQGPEVQLTRAAGAENVAAATGTAITSADPSSHVRYAGGAPEGDFTAMGWFKLLNDPDAEKTLLVVGGAASSPRYNEAHWLTSTNDGTTLAIGSLTPDHYIVTGGSLEVGIWHHVAMVGNTGAGQVFELYFDGALVGTGQETGTQQSYQAGMVEFGGFTNHDDDHFNGSFCGALVFNRRLSVGEIQSQMHYLSPLTPAWGAWGLQTRTDLNDLSGNGRTMVTAGVEFVNDPDGPPVSFAPGDACATAPDGTLCDDGNACTTNDACVNGACVGGAALVCDDGNVCTDDSCDPVQGCRFLENSVPCDDGNACTTNDTCAGGACVGGAPPNCDDGNGCTDDSCDAVQGCRHVNNTNPCNDGDACTTNDTCLGGTCVGGAPPSCDDGNICTTDACDPAVGCTHTNNNVICNDGDACTGNDVCLDGACGGTPINCDDGNVCTDDSCDPATGCRHLNNTNPCDDSHACTSGDVCAGGICGGTPIPGCIECTTSSQCNDGNGCTTDFCQGGVCVFVNNTDPCDDGNACTTNDICAGGACVGGPPPDCNDGNGCTDDSCLPASGCVHVDNANPCDDGNACTTGDACAGGVCLGGPPPVCDDGNVCTDDSCDPVQGCVFTNNHAACSDGNACTTNDTCSGGVCVGGSPLVCDDGNVCTDDSCDPIQGCRFLDNSGPCDDGSACTTNDICSGGACVGGAPPNCDDGNGCTDDSCDAVQGCRHVNNTNSCDDGMFCTVEDVCTNGECGGSQRDCSEVGDQCHPGVCNEATSLCEPQPAEDGTSCDDGDTCTSNDRCVSGSCRGEQAFGLVEWRQFAECYDGVGVAVEVGCECSDLDGDGDVDLQDVAEFMRRFNGN